MQKSITAPMILKKITIPYPRHDPCCLLAHNKVDDEIVDSDKKYLSFPVLDMQMPVTVPPICGLSMHVCPSLLFVLCHACMGFAPWRDRERNL